MWRFLTVSLLVPFVLLTPAAARAADEEPTVQGKKIDEWIELLRGEKAQTDRQTLLHGLGCVASHPNAWKWQTSQRLAGLIAVSLFSPHKSKAVFPELLRALQNDPDETIRLRAAQYLGSIGGRIHEDNIKDKGPPPIKLDDVRDGLVKALISDKAAKVRKASAYALGLLREDATPAVTLLVEALKDPDEGTQTAAAETLRVLGKTLSVRDALPQLEEALKNPKTNTATRVQLVITIGLIGKEANATLSLLTDILKDAKASNELRVAVAETLGKLVRRDALTDLKAILVKEGTSVELRRACVAAIDGYGPDAKPALPELLKAIYDKDWHTRASAMHAIGGIGKYLGSDSKAVVVELLKICNDPVLEVRVSAIETFGNLGAEALGNDLQTVLDKLTELSKDGQRDVRESAVEAQKKLKPPPAP